MLEIAKLMNSQANTISVSDERCPNCQRKLLLDGGREFCFSCEEVAAEDQEIAQEASRWIRDRETNELLSVFKDRSLMNKDLEAATLNEYQPFTESQREAKLKAVEYIQTFDGTKGLILIGKPGLGKSHIAASIGKAMAGKKKTSLFISMPRLMTEIKATYNRTSDKTEADLLKGLQTVDLLVIDDLGAERAGADDQGSAWSKTKIFEIVDARIGMATIYTTNYTASELIKMYGERDFGRMVQNVDVMKLEGRDYRFRQFDK